MRPVYFMEYSYCWSDCSPNLPGAASMFCSERAVTTSDGISFRSCIFTGSSHIRMVYDFKPMASQLPTPSTRFISGMILMSA